MQAHPIENIMKTTMEQITEMIDVNTIVGDAVEASDGSVIIPVSRVSFGFVAGGAEYGQGKEGKAETLSADDAQTGEDLPFGGGAGAGVCVSPMAFLVVGNGQVKLLPVDAGSLYGQIINAVPHVISELKDAFKGDKNKKVDINIAES
ncbi:MAG: sporulation protein YtfJ [Clostridiales bacterium]|jgi:sporulation protein YtfJ|nr:sporulation protein YtfJ [Clostridiales bacterium]